MFSLFIPNFMFLACCVEFHIQFHKILFGPVSFLRTRVHQLMLLPLRIQICCGGTQEHKDDIKNLQLKGKKN
ncbi:hypothetical protein KP509_01G071600 [Ceratopteris richardii]|uniref:Secreted protein n=1 Tax=Ceratopteris richardii TaxID=49495 RepID=A0A8T2VHL3_CERRI|nr:hypothetical protein KP509_01G071600 [Ceratopteris richardii]